MFGRFSELGLGNAQVHGLGESSLVVECWSVCIGVCTFRKPATEQQGRKPPLDFPLDFPSSVHILHARVDRCDEAHIIVSTMFASCRFLLLHKLRHYDSSIIG